MARRSLIGRIDRIDRNERTGELAVLDYKSSDSAKTPEQIHRQGRTSEKEWIDLQLPFIAISSARSICRSRRNSVMCFCPKMSKRRTSKSPIGRPRNWKPPMQLPERRSAEFLPVDSGPPPTRLRADFRNSPPFATTICSSPRRFQPTAGRNQRRQDEHGREKKPAGTPPPTAKAKQADAAFPHVLIRASAGTGKTFQLTNRYLGLAAAGCSPDHILAATFARKAAGEILDRVLTRLADAADDPKKLAELKLHLKLPRLDAAVCTRLLRGLVDRLHRLQISTLDSFFIQLAGSFSLELGLPPGWHIVESIEDKLLRYEAIQQVLHDHPLADTTQLVQLLGKGEATRSITDKIADIVESLYEVYRETAPTPDIWKRLPRLRNSAPLNSKMRCLHPVAARVR